MFKLIFPAIMCVALCCPMVGNAQDCCAPTPCCAPAPAQDCCAPRTRKKLCLVDVQRTVCKRSFVCVTDECGCTKRKMVKTQQCVTRKKLALVDVPVDPCKRSCLKNLGSRMRASMSRGCCQPDPCCGSSMEAAPMEAAPMEAAPDATAPVEPVAE